MAPMTTAEFALESFGPTMVSAHMSFAPTVPAKLAAELPAMVHLDGEIFTSVLVVSAAMLVAFRWTLSYPFQFHCTPDDLYIECASKLLPA